MLQPIKLESLRELVAAGSVRSATIRGQQGGYTVLASVGKQQRPLGTKLGDVRTFGSADTAIRVLRELGLLRFDLDVSNYEKGRLRAARPDVTQKARAASTALAHDRWFRQQVADALAREQRGEAIWHDHDTMWDELEAHAARLVEAREQRRSGAPAARQRHRASSRKG